MAPTRRDNRIPQENDILLAELITQEMGSMIVYKEAYDLDYPQHRKNIAPAELWQIARRKVIEELAAPLSEEPHSLQP